ncbi:MAG TPA: NYN domain-containing protein, partial [Terriglobia bacterium]|nr:NYN domain-containing protein [Terriglobia bacterium]
MNGSDRLKLAVFIDFDNIEIGVKSTLNRHFDVGTVLEAIKERGEVVTKIAYGDWKRAGDHSRSMTQHAIQMVQRNLTPGGDKNGADINLALDALEMAFTRNHINAFVIVGGDSDFMALVEKLKQYDKKVLVVGGRSFTSTILQKNCHEFIAYENLISAPQPSSRRPAERAKAAGPGDANLSRALPVVRRALKVLSDREVSPQLGLLKSTLLQLDSTFSERDYGASTFRDFIEKMASAGYVNLKQVDRSLLVELKEGAPAEEEESPQPGAEPVVAGPAAPAVVSFPSPSAPSQAQLEEGVRALFDAFQNAKNAPHWPMYLRNVKQYVKNAAPTFDERRYGFANFLEAVRAAGRSGLFRLERNRQGILRIFAGNQFPRPAAPPVFDIENEL